MIDIDKWTRAINFLSVDFIWMWIRYQIISTKKKAFEHPCVCEYDIWNEPALACMSNLIMNFCPHSLNAWPIISVNLWNEFIFGSEFVWKGQKEAVRIEWIECMMHLSVHVMVYIINYIMIRELYCGFHLTNECPLPNVDLPRQKKIP